MSRIRDKSNVWCGRLSRIRDTVLRELAAGQYFSYRADIVHAGTLSQGQATQAIEMYEKPSRITSLAILDGRSYSAFDVFVCSIYGSILETHAESFHDAKYKLLHVLMCICVLR